MILRVTAMRTASRGLYTRPLSPGGLVVLFLHFGLGDLLVLVGVGPGSSESFEVGGDEVLPTEARRLLAEVGHEFLVQGHEGVVAVEDLVRGHLGGRVVTEVVLLLDA